MQFFGVEFWELSKGDGGDLQAYVEDCIHRTFIENLEFPPAYEEERRRSKRVRPLPPDGVRLGLQFSPDESEIVIRDILEISLGGARCLYSGKFEIEEGAELHSVVIFFPDHVIECRGRIVYVLRGREKIIPFKPKNPKQS